MKENVKEHRTLEALAATIKIGGEDEKINDSFMFGFCFAFISNNHKYS